MYKLLSEYPRDRLLAVEIPLGNFSCRSRITDLRIVRIPEPPPFVGVRGRTMFDMSFLFCRGVWARWLERKVAPFGPDVVVAVIHGWFSEVALEVSRRLNIPFHAIIHDYFDVTFPVPQRLEGLAHRRWKRLCSLASSRICVSPFMADAVQRETQRKSCVLYPGLSADLDLGDRRSVASSRSGGSIRFAFAGSIHPSFQSMISRLSKILQRQGDSLVLHSPHALGALANGVTDGGAIESDRLADILASEADVLFLPMSFRAEVEKNVRLCFPSKLVEYCAAGRPVLIWAPPYSSAVRWAKEHSGFAEIVDADSDDDLSAAVERLRDQGLRERKGSCALSIAGEFFSHNATFGRFLDIVCD